jgi:hypothetical protein
VRNPASEFLTNLGVCQKSEKAGPADHVPGQRGEYDPAKGVAQSDLACEQQQEGLRGAGDDMREAAERDGICERQHDPELTVGDAGANPG